MKRWWFLLVLAACNEPTPQQEVEVDAAVDAVVAVVPCPGQVFPEDSGHSGQLVWDGQSFVLGYTGGYNLPGGVEGWSVNGELRWSRALQGRGVGLWRAEGQTHALGRDEEGRTLAWRVALDGSVEPIVWPSLEEVWDAQVLPFEGGVWVISETTLARIEGTEVRWHHQVEGYSAGYDYFLNGAVTPEGDLRVTSLWFPPRDDAPLEYRLATFLKGGQRVYERSTPGFAPRGVAFGPDGAPLMVGVRFGPIPQGSPDRPRLGGRLVGLTEAPMDFDHLWPCSEFVKDNTGLDRLIPLRNGDWLVLGYLCSSYDDHQQWLLRLAPDGQIRWQARLRLMAETVIDGVAEADDGTIALSGTASECCYDVTGWDTPWLMFVDPEGQCLDAVR